MIASQNIKKLFTGDNMSGDLNDELQKVHFGEQPPELAETNDLPTIISQTKTVLVDVGASVGEYTKAFIDICPDCEVIAIDADAQRFEQLTSNIEVWTSHFSVAGGPKVIPIFGALSDVEGELTFSVNDSGTSGSLAPTPLAGQWRSVSVPAYRLDDIVSSHDHVFVKMDIEGGEYSCLLGASKLLQGTDNDFQMELHYWGDETKGTGVRDVLNIFKESGYGVKKYHRHYFFSKSIPVSAVRMNIIAFQYSLYPLKQKLEFGFLSPLTKPFVALLRSIYRRL